MHFDNPNVVPLDYKIRYEDTCSCRYCDTKVDSNYDYESETFSLKAYHFRCRHSQTKDGRYVIVWRGHETYNKEGFDNLTRAIDAADDYAMWNTRHVSGNVFVVVDRLYNDTVYCTENKGKS